MLSSRSLTALVPGLILIALTPIVAGCDRQSGDAAQPAAAAGSDPEAMIGKVDRSHKGSQLPDFTFRDAAGKELRLPSLKGKPVLINIWATWCAPCVAELPTLDGLAAAQGNTMAVLAVSQDTGDPQMVPAFFRQHGVSHLQPWLDPDGQLSQHYAVQIYPTTIYYDAQGRELWRFVGDRDWGSSATAALLAER